MTWEKMTEKEKVHVSNKIIQIHLEQLDAVL